MDSSLILRLFPYRRPKPEARLRLFCFPFAGGTASVFRPWVAELPPTVEVCPVQYPGRERRVADPPVDRLSELVAQIREGMSLLEPLPFAFFGHSLGALVGFELARQLRHEGAALPRCLFVSGGAAPQLPGTGPGFSSLGDEDFVRELHRIRGTPRGVLDSPEMMALVIPMLRRDFALFDTYSYQHEEPLSCPIIALGGAADTLVHRLRIEPWAAQTSSTFRLHLVQGDHFFLLTNRAALLGLLQQELAGEGGLGLV